MLTEKGGNLLFEIGKQPVVLRVAGIEKIPALFRQHGWYLLDGSDPATFGLDDRCMRDEDHAQETYHLALLREMGRDALVRTALHINPDYLQAMLADSRTTVWYPHYPEERAALSRAN